MYKRQALGQVQKGAPADDDVPTGQTRHAEEAQPAYVPSRHSEQSPAPPEDEDPGLQSVQYEKPVVDKVREAPVYCPAGQGKHEVTPIAAAKYPALQDVQPVDSPYDPEPLEKVPGEHAEQTVYPDVKVTSPV